MIKTVLLTAFISVTAFTAVSFGAVSEEQSPAALSLVQEKGGQVTSADKNIEYGRWGRWGHHGGRWGHHGGRWGHHGGRWGHHGHWGHHGGHHY